MTDPGSDAGRPFGAGYARLARCLGANDREGALAALAAVAGDPALAATLRRHHLATLLAATLGDDALRARLPAAAHAALRVWLDRQRPSAAEHLRALAEARAALAEHGVDCMVLKGLYFADRLYGGLERRGQYDVDLLVRRRDFRRASRALRALGYAARWRDLHSVTWRRATTHVDLHACFRNAPPYRLDEARTWAERVPWAIGEVAFPTPSDEDTLVMLALALFQDVGLGSAQLKQLLDVYLLAVAVDAAFDWERFMARRAPERTLAIVVNVLDLACRVLDEEGRLPRLAAALAPHRARCVAGTRVDALALVLGDAGAARNRAWFLALYPGSIAWYWLWLLPRKLPAYLSGRAPGRTRSALRPSLATLRAVLQARRPAAIVERPPRP